MTTSEMVLRKPQTEARANNIADALNHRPQMLGFDFGAILLIITKLLPMIIDCFDPDDGPQAAAYVNRRYDSGDSDDSDNTDILCRLSYRGYDKRLVKATTRRVKQAARRQGQRVTWSQAYEMAYATLDNIREGDQQQCSVAIAENHDYQG